MAGQARQIALRKLEVAVLSHGAFQAQRNGFCALLSDVLACYLSFTHASRLQDFIQIGRTGAIRAEYKTAANLPDAVQQSRLYGCVASGCAPT